MLKYLFVIVILFPITLYSKIGEGPIKAGRIFGGVSFFAQQARISEINPNAVDYSRPYLGGFALNIQGGLTRWLVGDISLNYSKVQFYRDNEAFGFISESSHRILLPIVFRTWLFPFLSLGGGFYASYLVGSVETVQGQVPTEGQTSAHDTGEHGLKFLIGLNCPQLLWDLYWGLDYRVDYSLTQRPNEARVWHRYLVTVQKAF